MALDLFREYMVVGGMPQAVAEFVKSSRRYDHVSLDKFTAKYRRSLAVPVVLHTKDVMEKGGLTYLPLYMASCL